MTQVEIIWWTKIAIRSFIRWTLYGALAGVVAGLGLLPTGSFGAIEAVLIGAFFGAMLGPVIGLAYLGLRWVYTD